MKDEDPDQLKKILNYRFQLLSASLMEIIKTLRFSKQQLKFWMHGSYGLELFSQEKVFDALNIKQEYYKNKHKLSKEARKELTQDWMFQVLGISSEMLLQESFSLFDQVIAKNIKDKELLCWHTNGSYNNCIYELLLCLQYEIFQVTRIMHHSVGDRPNEFKDLPQYRPQFNQSRTKNPEIGGLTDIHNSNVAYKKQSTSLIDFLTMIARIIWEEEFSTYQINALKLKNVYLKSKTFDDDMEKFIVAGEDESIGLEYWLQCVVRERVFKDKAVKVTNTDNHEIDLIVDNGRKVTVYLNKEHRDMLKNLEKFLKLILVTQKGAKKKGKDLKTDSALLKQLWTSKLTTEYYRILSLVRVLNGLVYMYLQRAKTLRRIYKYRKDEKGSQNVSFEAENYLKQLWVRVSVLCWLGLDLLKNVHPDLLSREMPLKFDLLVFYGLSLSHLGRFYEAHRRLNEASTYVNSSESTQFADVGMLRLRRAEVHIAIAETIGEKLDKLNELNKCNTYSAEELRNLPIWIKDMQVDEYIASQNSECKIGVLFNLREAGCLSHDQMKQYYKKIIDWLTRMYFVKLDDAAISIESAEHCMSDADRTSLWWGHLYFMKLKLIRLSYGLESDIPLYKSMILRKNRDLRKECFSIFNKCWLLCLNDTFRQLRLLDEFIRNVHCYRKSLESQGKIKESYEYTNEVARFFIAKGIKQHEIDVESIEQIEERHIKSFVIAICPKGLLPFSDLLKESTINEEDFLDLDYSPTLEYLKEVMLQVSKIFRLTREL